MKVELVSDKDPHRATWKGNKVETIELKGNIIFPYYIPVLSIEHHPEKLVMRLNGRYKTKITHEYDTANNKSDDRLWILGEDKIPVVEGGEEEKIM